LSGEEFDRNRKSLNADTALWLWRRQEEGLKAGLNTG
jgi:hypothetical protein